MPTTRRDFLKFTGIGIGVAVASSMLPNPFRKLSRAEAAEITDYAAGLWVPSCCNMCGGQCGVLAYVEDGMVRKIEPNRQNPNNVANVYDNFIDARDNQGDPGRLCCKGNSALKSLYDPDRLRTPLKRVGERGSGQFVSITWDEALAEVAQKLYAIKAAHGGRSILWFGEDHSFTHIQQDFCDAIGAPHYSNHANLCDVSRKSSFKAAIGDERPLADMENTNLLFIWGWNFLSAIKWIHLPAIFTRARQRDDFKFIYVDPVFNTTASKADTWLAPRPGTDGALALGIAKELLDYDNGTGLKINESWIDAWTVGFEDYRDYLDGLGTDATVKDAAWAASITGVAAARITAIAEQLGDAYQRGDKICFDSWSGPGHHTNATQGGRAIVSLALLLGAVDAPGTLMLPLRNSPGRLPGPVDSGGAAIWKKDPLGWRLDGRDDVTIPSASVAPSPITSTRDLYDKTGVLLPAGADLRGKGFHKKYQYSHGSGIYCEARDSMLSQQDFLGIPFPTKAVVFVFQNFVMSTPNTQKNIDAINKMEFVLAVDTHLSETAMLADIVIPGSHYLERFDFNAAWITFRALGMRQPVVSSWIGGRSEAQFFMDLGATMGLAGFDAASSRDVDFNLNRKEWENHIKGFNNKLSWDGLLATGVWVETRTGATDGSDKGGTQLYKYRTVNYDLGKVNTAWMTVTGAAGAWQVTVTGEGTVIGTSTATTKPANGASFTLGAAYSAKGFQPALMRVELSSSMGGSTRYYVKGGATSGGAILGVTGGLATLAQGAPIPLGFNTETKFAQFWSQTFNKVWTAVAGAPGSGTFPAGQLYAGEDIYHPLPHYVAPIYAPDSEFPLYFISWKEVEHTHTRTFTNEYLMEMKGENKLFVHPTVATAKGLGENDRAWVQTAYGAVRVRVHITTGIQAQTVGFVRGFGHWALGPLAKGRGAHDGWLLPGGAEIHSGQAVHKEVACRIYKDLL